MNKYEIEEKCLNVLDYIKPVQYLTKDMVVSVRQVANYYEVPKKNIEMIIKRHRDELEEDGIMVLKGQDLKDFKEKVCEVHGNENKLISNKTQSFTIMTKRVMILIGFCLQDNEISKKLKSEILKINPKDYTYFENKTKEVKYVKRYESEFGNILNKLLGKYNKIEKQVKCGKYHIDFTINDYIAIEVDENGHSSYDKIKEKEGEEFIKSKGYKLFRFNPMKDDALVFLGDIIQKII